MLLIFKIVTITFHSTDIVIVSGATQKFIHMTRMNDQIENGPKIMHSQIYLHAQHIYIF